MSGGTDTLKGANVSKCIPRPLLANSCEVRFSECGFPYAADSLSELHINILGKTGFLIKEVSVQFRDYSMF